MADLPLVLRIGQVEVGLRRIGHVRLVIENDPRPLREAEPLVVGILQVGRNARFQHVAVDGLQDPGVLGPLQPRGIDRQQHVGGAVRTLGLHPRDQLVGIALDPVDGDPGHLLEVGIEPLVGVVMARRIEVHLAVGEGIGGQHGRGGKRQKRGLGGAVHRGDTP